MILKFFKWLLTLFLIAAIPVNIYGHFVYGMSIQTKGIVTFALVTCLLFVWDAKRTARRRGYR
ncbi:hypothetical protein [Brevibacillus reuszeri]|uniref:hypothetical protein n=1 Tax=Brevibacillus reuszeri TaxID=54915 RepID=UPI003D192CB1